MKTINQNRTTWTTIKILTVLFTAISTVAFAHGGDQFRRNLYASVTNFVENTTTDSWRNATSQTGTKANYSNFSGETFVSLISYDKQAEVLIESNVKVTKGELRLIVENGSGEILFEKHFQKDDQVTAQLTLEVYELYKIRFIGESAKGSYNCKWTQL